MPAKMFKVLFASVASLYLLLSLFVLLGNYECFSLVVVFVSLVIIASSYIEFGLKQKRCVYLCFFYDKSLIFRLLTSPYLLVVFLTFYSALLSISIFLEVFTFTLWIWLYLGLHTVVMTLLFYKVKALLSASVKPEMLDLIAMGLSAKIGAIIFFIVYILFFYYSETPAYIQETLLKTIHLATQDIHSSCAFVEYFAQLKVELNATMLWSLLYSTQYLENENYKILLWLGYFISSALSAIGINRLIVQIIYLLQKNLGDKNGD